MSEKRLHPLGESLPVKDQLKAEVTDMTESSLGFRCLNADKEQLSESL
ncbi:MAG TPA: hypothetical protein VF017_17110 [Thermoanaerobaculia bacterium]|nr:hypothetical protein [Thermoanaerobaculia bacterium]